MDINLNTITNTANSIIFTPSRLINSYAKFDYRFANPAAFKPNDMGFPVNNWVRISSKDVKTQSFANKTKVYLKDLVTESESIFGKELVTDNYIDILLFNVFINTSKTPKVIVNEVKGLENGTIKQIFTPGDYDIIISGVLSSPFSFQPDTYSIEDLNKLVNAGTTLYIQNTELNKLYNINKVVITSLSINFNQKFSNLRDFTITLKSDDAIDIFKLIQK